MAVSAMLQTPAGTDLVDVIVAVAATVVVIAVAVTIFRARKIGRVADTATALRLELEIAALRGVSLRVNDDPAFAPRATSETGPDKPKQPAPAQADPTHADPKRARAKQGQGVPERLAKLEDLHAHGLISDDERAAARAKVLSQL